MISYSQKQKKPAELEKISSAGFGLFSGAGFEIRTGLFLCPALEKVDQRWPLIHSDLFPDRLAGEIFEIDTRQVRVQESAQQAEQLKGRSAFA